MWPSAASLPFKPVRCWTIVNLIWDFSYHHAKHHCVGIVGICSALKQVFGKILAKLAWTRQRSISANQVRLADRLMMPWSQVSNFRGNARLSEASTAVVTLDTLFVRAGSDDLTSSLQPWLSFSPQHRWSSYDAHHLLRLNYALPLPQYSCLFFSFVDSL